MTYIFIALLIILLIAHYLRDTNPYKLTLIFGKKGSGKTSDIAKRVTKLTKKGYVCYSNVPIKGAYTYNPKDIGLYTFPPGSVVFCDEVGLIWNNRDYRNFKDCVTSWFKFQRQYKISMYIYSQANDVDKKIRDLTDKIYITKRLGRFSILRSVVKNIGISKDADGNGSIVDTYSYDIFDTHFTYLPRYYGFFESFNPPDLPLIDSVFNDYDELSTIYLSNTKYFLYRFKLACKNSKLFSNVYNHLFILIKRGSHEKDI